MHCIRRPRVCPQPGKRAVPRCRRPNGESVNRRRPTTRWQKPARRLRLANQFPGVPEYAVELARCDAEAGDHALARKQYAAAADAFHQAADRVAPLVAKFTAIMPYQADSRAID